MLKKEMQTTPFGRFLEPTWAYYCPHPFEEAPSAPTTSCFHDCLYKSKWPYLTTLLRITVIEINLQHDNHALPPTVKFDMRFPCYCWTKRWGLETWGHLCRLSEKGGKMHSLLQSSSVFYTSLTPTWSPLFR